MAQVYANCPACDVLYTYHEQTEGRPDVCPACGAELPPAMLDMIASHLRIATKSADRIASARAAWLQWFAFASDDDIAVFHANALKILEEKYDEPRTLTPSA